MRPFLFLPFLLFCISPLFAEEKPREFSFTPEGGNVTYTFSSLGLSGIKVGDHELATGGFLPFDAAPMLTPADNPLPAHPAAAAGYAANIFDELKQKPRHASIAPHKFHHSDYYAVEITHTLPGIKSETMYIFDKQNIYVHFTLTNTANVPLQVPSITGLKFTFPQAPAGRMLTWHPSYLQHANRDCFHPSHLNRVGGSYLIGGKIGVGVSPGYTVGSAENADPLTTPIIPTLIHWDYDSWEPDRRDAEPVRWLTYSQRSEIPPGGSISTQLAIRISSDCATPPADADWQNLLEPYKAHFLRITGGLQYKPDYRMVASAYLNHSQGAISADNPLGLHGGYNRLDTDAGVAQFAEKFIPAIQKQEGQGMLLWGHSGDHPRGAMYRVDADCIPPVLEANLRKLAKQFHEAGLTLGVCTRPGELTTPISWQHDYTVQLSPSEPTQLADVLRRFKNLREMGFSIFYLDSFGMRPEHVEIMRHLRRQLGPDVQTWAEHPCDLILAYSGGYSETDFHAATPDGQTPDRWNLYSGEENVKIYHWLLGRAPIIARHYTTHGEMPADFESIEDYVKRQRLILLRPVFQFKD